MQVWPWRAYEMALQFAHSMTLMHRTAIPPSVVLAPLFALSKPHISCTLKASILCAGSKQQPILCSWQASAVCCSGAGASGLLLAKHLSSPALPNRLCSQLLWIPYTHIFLIVKVASRRRKHHVNVFLCLHMLRKHHVKQVFLCWYVYMLICV